MTDRPRYCFSLKTNGEEYLFPALPDRASEFTAHQRREAVHLTRPRPRPVVCVFFSRGRRRATAHAKAAARPAAHRNPCPGRAGGRRRAGPGRRRAGRGAGGRERGHVAGTRASRWRRRTRGLGGGHEVALAAVRSARGRTAGDAPAKTSKPPCDVAANQCRHRERVSRKGPRLASEIRGMGRKPGRHGLSCAPSRCLGDLDVKRKSACPEYPWLLRCFSVEFVWCQKVLFGPYKQAAKQSRKEGQEGSQGLGGEGEGGDREGEAERQCASRREICKGGERECRSRRRARGRPAARGPPAPGTTWTWRSRKASSSRLAPLGIFRPLFVQCSRVIFSVEISCCLLVSKIFMQQNHGKSTAVVELRVSVRLDCRDGERRGDKASAGAGAGAAGRRLHVGEGGRPGRRRPGPRPVVHGAGQLAPPRAQPR